MMTMMMTMMMIADDDDDNDGRDDDDDDYMQNTAINCSWLFWTGFVEHSEETKCNSLSVQS